MTLVQDKQDVNSDIPRLSSQSLQELRDFGWTAVPDFMSSNRIGELYEDVQQLRASGHFHTGDIGHDGLEKTTSAAAPSQPFRDVRHAEICPWWNELVVTDVNKVENEGNMVENEAIMVENNVSDANKVENKDPNGLSNGTSATTKSIPMLPPNETRSFFARHVMRHLQQDLQQQGPANDITVPLDPQLTEVQYAYYPQHGHYQRHVDAEAGTPSEWRRYSFLLYLNPDWSADRDGGALRVHRDTGNDERPADELPNFVDLPPTGGTLVVMDSHAVPHQVLETFRAGRCAVVGWFLGSTTPLLASARRWVPTLVEPLALTALQSLRATLPRLQATLEPQTTAPTPSFADSNGMLGDDWGLVMPSGPAAEELKEDKAPVVHYKDTDPAYWKSIAAFDEQGRVVTLRLSGQRLHRVDASAFVSSLQPLWTPALTTLDLANTDAPGSVLIGLLEQALSSSTTKLTQLYLGGNGRTWQPVELELLVPLWCRVSVLDLRYNDLGPHVAAHLSPLLAPGSAVQHLYLEGNALGDDGVRDLLSTTTSTTTTPDEHLRGVCELYLGQNNIGPVGARHLAQALENGSLSYLEKLYIEGNRLGNEGAQEFCQVLSTVGPERRRLNKLYVDNNGVGKQESIALGSALGSLSVIGEGGIFQE